MCTIEGFGQDFDWVMWVGHHPAWLAHHATWIGHLYGLATSLLFVSYHPAWVAQHSTLVCATQVPLMGWPPYMDHMPPYMGCPNTVTSKKFSEF